MQYEPSEPLALPSSEQLQNFRGVCRRLQDIPRSVLPLEQVAFKNLILGLCPGAGESWEYTMVEHLFPEDWRQYCEQRMGHARRTAGA